MENKTKSKLIAGLLILSLLILGQKYKNLSNENYDLEDENYQLSRTIDDYQEALEEANDNIEQANSYIEEAQDYAWSSYGEMGEALDNLQTVDTISEP